VYKNTPRPSGRRTVDGLDRSGICKRYQGKVMYLARRLAERLPSDAGISVDDLASYGAIGLLEAFDHFDESLNIRFGTYAEYRIRGAMLDALRSMDSLSRRQRNMARQIEDATRKLQLDHGQPPAPEQVAEKLGMDIESYWKALEQAAPVSHMSLEDNDSSKDDGGSDMLEGRLASTGEEVLVTLASRDARRMLETAIRALPERKRQCVMMYYGRDYSLAEIAEVYGVSVSRISQILSESRTALRKVLQEQIAKQDLDWREAI
jgi:RNA polymerase sigma factor for flagellar operon FliA